MSELVTYSVAGSVATITLDDGKANSLSPQMIQAIHGALDRAEKDRAIVVLAGRPQRFSAGFDLNIVKAGGPPAAEMFLMGFRLAERMLAFPTPIVAACTGHALAMGSFLLLASDVRIGAAGVFKIGANEVAIGLTMPYSAVEFCRQRLTPAHFTRAVLTAEIYTPEHAVVAGFLDHVVAAEQVVPEAQQLAATFTQLHLTAHAESKLRARSETLAALRTAIEKDEADFRSRF